MPDTKLVVYRDKTVSAAKLAHPRVPALGGLQPSKFILCEERTEQRVSTCSLKPWSGLLAIYHGHCNRKPGSNAYGNDFQRRCPGAGVTLRNPIVFIVFILFVVFGGFHPCCPYLTSLMSKS